MLALIPQGEVEIVNKSVLAAIPQYNNSCHAPIVSGAAVLGIQE
jgi:hypothetical protein